MYKQHLIRVVAALAATAAVPAFAGQADLTVKGSITPTACTASALPTAFGMIPASDLEPVGDTTLGPQQNTLVIQCRNAGRFALRVTDNDPNSVSESGVGRFGMGKQENGHKNGYFTLSIAANEINGGLNQLLASPVLDGSGTWTSLGSATEAVDTTKIYGFASASETMPATIKKLNVPLRISLTIAEGLDVSAPAEMRGEAMIDLVYL